MRPVLLDPTEITATYQAGVLTIQASGHEEGVTDIRIVSEAIEPVEPPQFRIEGAESPAIGFFPYSVEATFPMDDDPHEIGLETSSGTRIVAVRSLTSH
jgi:hypothetical protein